MRWCVSIGAVPVAVAMAGATSLARRAGLEISVRLISRQRKDGGVSPSSGTAANAAHNVSPRNPLKAERQSVLNMQQLLTWRLRWDALA